MRRKRREEGDIAAESADEEEDAPPADDDAEEEDEPESAQVETSGSLGSRVLAGLVDAGVVGMLVAVFAVGAHLIV